MNGLDYYLAVRPIPGNEEEECGDIGIVKEFRDRLFVAVIDILGHGREAHELARVARDFLGANYRRDLLSLMEGLHDELRGSRGAVAALCLVHSKSGDVRYVGVGNVTTRTFGSNHLRLVPRNGIIGYAMRSTREEKMRLGSGDVLIMHTDGVQEHFDPTDYPEITRDSAETICHHVIQEFGKKQDDAACVALRYRT